MTQTPFDPGAKRAPIQVVMLSLPPRTQSLLEFFFHHAGRGSFIVSAEDKAETAIFDWDTQASKDHWAQFHARTGQPGIGLAVKQTEVPGGLWVQKPVTPAALLAAAAALREGRFNGHAQPLPSAPPEQVEFGSPAAAAEAAASPPSPAPAPTPAAAAPVAAPVPGPAPVSEPLVSAPAETPAAPSPSLRLVPAPAPAPSPAAAAEPEPGPDPEPTQPPAAAPTAEHHDLPSTAPRAAAPAAARIAGTAQPAARRSLWQRWLFGDDRASQTEAESPAPAPASAAPSNEPATAQDTGHPLTASPASPQRASDAPAPSDAAAGGEPIEGESSPAPETTPESGTRADERHSVEPSAEPSVVVEPTVPAAAVQPADAQAPAEPAEPIDDTATAPTPASEESPAAEAEPAPAQRPVSTLGRPNELSGMPPELLFGTRADATAQQWHDNPELRFDPQTYLVGCLREAAMVSSKWQVPTRFDVTGGEVVVDAERNEVWAAFPTPQLLDLARQPLEQRGKVQTLSQVEFARFKERRDTALPEQRVRLDDLLWRTAMLGSAGRLVRGADPQRTVYLRQWPNLTRLMPAPHAARLAALWALRGSSVMDSARLFGIDQRIVVGFHAGVWALNLLTDDGSLAKRAQRKSARNRGLLSRLLGWLRG